MDQLNAIGSGESKQKKAICMKMVDTKIQPILFQLFIFVKQYTMQQVTEQKCHVLNLNLYH